MCAHDGFTLADLVTYNNKYNLSNGENNSDGENHNLSWNCGQVMLNSPVSVFSYSSSSQMLPYGSLCS